MPTIKVTKENIRYGNPGDSDCCAVALAMGEAGYKCASVYDKTIQFDRKGEQISFPTPDAVKAFIKRYDDPTEEDPKIENWNVEMFEGFEFEVPEQP